MNGEYFFEAPYGSETVQMLAPSGSEAACFN